MLHWWTARPVPTAQSSPIPRMHIGRQHDRRGAAQRVEAVRLWTEDAIAEGEALPQPRSAETLRADPEIAEAIAEGAALAIVPLLLDAGRPAKANLSIDAGLLAAIDDAAEARGLTRSAFLASAAREKIESGS